MPTRKKSDPYPWLISPCDERTKSIVSLRGKISPRTIKSNGKPLLAWPASDEMHHLLKRLRDLGHADYRIFPNPRHREIATSRS